MVINIYEKFNQRNTEHTGIHWISKNSNNFIAIVSNVSIDALFFECIIL